MAEPIQFQFNYRSPEAIAAAESAAAALVTAVSEEIRGALRALVVKGIQDGIPPAKLARLIQDAVGLNMRQAIALANYQAALEGSGLSAARLAKQVQSYRDRMLRRRKQMIARTETMRAMNVGRLEAALQAQAKGLLGPDAEKEWDAAPENTTASGGNPRCEVCGRLDGERRPLAQPFSSGDQQPPEHPHCRCSLKIHPGRPAAQEQPETPFTEVPFTTIRDISSEMARRMGVGLGELEVEWSAYDDPAVNGTFMPKTVTPRAVFRATVQFSKTTSQRIADFMMSRKVGPDALRGLTTVAHELTHSLSGVWAEARTARASWWRYWEEGATELIARRRIERILFGESVPAWVGGVRGAYGSYPDEVARMIWLEKQGVNLVRFHESNSIERLRILNDVAAKNVRSALAGSLKASEVETVIAKLGDDLQRTIQLQVYGDWATRSRRSMLRELSENWGVNL